MAVLEYVATEDNVEEQILHQELEEKIAEAIALLPPRCQEIFKLSRFEELTYKQIAARLEISVKTVENQMGKALKVLKSALKQYLQLLLLFFIF